MLESDVKAKIIPFIVQTIDDLFQEVANEANQADLGSNFSHFISTDKDGVYWICLIRKKSQSVIPRKFTVRFDPYELPEKIDIRYFVSGKLTELNLELDSKDWINKLNAISLFWINELVSEADLSDFEGMHE